MNRPNTLKLPLLVRTLRESGHPLRNEAIENLQVYLGRDEGADWTRWDAAVRETLDRLVLLPGALQARDYRIVSEGAERVFRVSGENTLVEIAADGTIGEPLSASPRVVVRAAREAEMPELARGVGAMKWSRTRVGLHYNLEFESLARALEALVKLQAQGREASLAIRRQKHSRFTPRDPLFKDQWHLRNTGQLGGTKGIDLNISEAWKTRRGKGVSIAVIDDGLEINHPDLVANCFTVASGMHRDFNSNDANPSPERGNDHGTAVASVLASPSNTLGGLGVAPEAKLAGLRLTADATDGEMEASAFAWKNDAFAIYNNSWGPSDDGKTLEGPAAIARDAILAGTKFGRKGIELRRLLEPPPNHRRWSLERSRCPHQRKRARSQCGGGGPLLQRRAPRPRLRGSRRPPRLQHKRRE